MIIPPPPIDDDVRARIRRRAEVIRRRRRRLAALGVVVALVAAGGAIGAATDGGGRGHRQLIVGAPCPASGLVVTARSGEQASFTAIPSGWQVTGDGTHLSETPLTVAPPGATTARPAENSSQYPNISLSQTAIPPNSGVAVQIGSVTGSETTEAGGEGITSSASVTWTPDPGVQLSLYGVAIPAPELLAVARGVHFQPGTVAPLPATVHAVVSASAAEHALPSRARLHASAALTSWLEIDHVRQHALGYSPVAPGADDRAAWLVAAPTGRGDRTWAVVDATTGKTLQRPVTDEADWVTAVSNRAAPSCQPPLGVLTRSEATQAIFGSPAAPAGTTIALLDQSDLYTNVHNTITAPADTCDQPCDPLIWVSRSAHRLATFDAITGEPEFDESGAGVVPALPAGDLDPGPTITAPTTTTTTPVPTTPPATYPIVGPSPFQPGTREAKPAPEGNGNGPQGSCTGSETSPPCGPGVQLHRYYPYTLHVSCDQDVRFDGRLWRQGLLPPDNEGYETVWMVLNTPTSAGWVGPGAVGMMPAPAQPPSCPKTNPSIPPISSITPQQ